MTDCEYFMLLSVIIWCRHLSRREAMVWASIFSLIAFVMKFGGQ